MGTHHSNYAVTQGPKAKVNYRAIFGLPPRDKAAMLVVNSIRLLHLLAYPLLFISPGYYSRPKKNSKQCYAKFGAANKVHYGTCASGEYNFFREEFT